MASQRDVVARFVGKQKSIHGLKGSGHGIVRHGRPGSALDNQYNNPHGTQGGANYKKPPSTSVAKGGGNPFGGPLPNYGNVPPARRPSRAGGDIAQGAYQAKGVPIKTKGRYGAAAVRG